MVFGYRTNPILDNPGITIEACTFPPYPVGIPILPDAVSQSAEDLGVPGGLPKID